MENLLDKINSPKDLKTLSQQELLAYSQQLREFLIDSIFTSGGHFAGNLGVIELSVALHFVFDSPHDPIIWDVGHQSYAHKVITGRKNQLRFIRHLHGISGFPKKDENIHDIFGTGHSSTSISAALGMAKAFAMQNKNNTAVAVIGDGALTGGMAFEAINHTGVENLNILIIINDNHMGIDPNSGAIDKLLPIMNSGNENFFEQLGIPYFGPIDGHDLPLLIENLNTLKNTSGKKILHVKTIKGKGYQQAEKEQTTWHSTVKYVKIEASHHIKNLHEKWQDIFGDTLVQLATENQKICGVTPAMPTGSGMIKAMQKFPDRFWDVGIAEQHAVTFSAGLASQGFIPFCNIYSSFTQRAYDQIIHDVALQKLPVIFCLDRAGLVGEDGPTHHGVFDLSFLNPIPNIFISSPRDAQMLKNLMYFASSCEQPMFIRYPKGEIPIPIFNAPEKIIPGKAQIISKGEKIAVFAFGHTLNFASDLLLKFPNQITLIDPIFLKPFDLEMLKWTFNHFSHIVTVEDGSLIGGLYSTLLFHASHFQFKGKIHGLGIPDAFIEHGSNSQLYEICGFGPLAIEEKIASILNNLSNS